MRPTDPRITSSLAIVAVAVWLGGLLALGALAAPVVFSIVPAPWSADAMTVVFVRFDRVAMSCAGVVLVVEAVRARMPVAIGRLDVVRVATAVVASGLAIAEGVWLSPRIVALHRAGAIRGLGELGAALESTHQMAELCGKAQTVLLMGLIGMHVFTAARGGGEGAGGVTGAGAGVRASASVGAGAGEGWPVLASGWGRGKFEGSMRVVGKRKEGTGDRAGLDALVLKFGGGARKGVFRYRSQEEANRDWDRWISERVQRRMTTSSG